MTDPDRRKFLQLTAFMVGTGPLIGCGGSSDDGAATMNTDALSSSEHMVALRVADLTTSSTGATTSAMGSGVGLMQFKLSSMAAPQSSRSIAKAARPFSLGYAFRRGDIPPGSTVASNLGGLQVTPRNYWPDGSLKFAQLAGLVSLPTSEQVVVSLNASTNVLTGAALSLTDLKHTGATARISGGNFGTAEWSDTAWDAPFKTWVSGSLMSSWIYRKPLSNDAHLVAWLEVRLFAGGAVEVLPWIENGYLNVAAPTNKSAAYQFILGGTARFSAPISLPHHTRTPLIVGTALSYWLGADPGVIPDHNKAYLQSTELVPSYMANTTNLSVGYPVTATSFAPLQQGDYKFGSDQTDAMTNSGYGEPIGLLPGWDAKYLTCTSDLNTAAYGAVVRNGYSAGRYPIHYRDEVTNRPPRFSGHGTRALWSPGNNGSGFTAQGGGSSYTPAIIDTTGTKTWDTAHAPAVGFLPYLLTGRFYFMEECQFAAVTNFLGMDAGPTQRNGTLGLFQPDYGAWQVRACAWGLRALGHALVATPDDDVSLRAEFLASMQANIDRYHSRHVAQPSNPLGGFIDWDQVSGTGVTAPWQIDFMTGAFGYLASMGMPLASGYQTKLLGVVGYSARSIVGRLGLNNSTDWWWSNAFPYQMTISPGAVPNWAAGTGPWFNTFRDAYNATYATPPGWLGSTEGRIALEYPNPADAARGFLANALPAISYAVRHGVSGALEAYNRLIGASNFATLTSEFSAYPLWGQRPCTGLNPLWLQDKPMNEWFAISGTSGAAGAMLNDYCGFDITTAGVIVAGAAGGHGSGSADNRVVSLDLLADVPAWVQRIAPSPAHSTALVAYEADGKPKGRHTYHSVLYMPTLGRMMLFGVRFDLEQNTFNAVDGIDTTNWTWSGAGAYADASPAGAYASVVDGDGNAWWINHNNGAAAKYTASTNKWSSPAISNAVSPNVRYPWAWDRLRGQLFGLTWGDGEGFGAGIRAVRMAGNAQTAITFSSGSAAVIAQFAADAPQYAGMGYDADNDRFLFFSTSAPTRIYVVKPNSSSVWDLSLLSLGGGSATLPATGAPVVSKFRYVPQLKGFVCLPDAKQALFFMRTA